jgi:hypothetical protein
MTSFKFDLVGSLRTMHSSGSPARTLPLPSELVGADSSIENIPRIRALPGRGQFA